MLTGKQPKGRHFSERGIALLLDVIEGYIKIIENKKTACKEKTSVRKLKNITSLFRVIPPPIKWAQRSAVVFLTVNLEDVKDPDIKFTKDSVYFKGTGGLEKKMYEVTIPLYKEIDPEKSKSFNRERCIEIVLTKDEDESGDELGGMGGGGDFEEMMRQMGGLGGGGEKANFDDLDLDEGEENDSDDEPIPTLE
ncbi:telomerase-binding protein p23 hsp90 co-chaperone [Holotrichia oblita]|uniref:Telomerase-binding protein p23 hsp90 co-chaperone n=1 Tax=Holotrichia oblita TaxID=644536 RepID=A0ACB9TEF2_HOLOL|nr:telomerase-binding protein p23 hsp90 co-chaperone [Holotrichia oblita]